MDKDLIFRLGAGKFAPPSAGGHKTDPGLRIVDEATGEVEVNVDGPAGGRHTLKPLGELYGQGPGLATVDPKDDRFMPLFMGIEAEIARYYEDDEPGLTDGQVLLALKQLGLSPEAESADRLTRRVQLALRLVLSLNDYSRHDVRTAIRHIARSVERHTKAEGRVGYLDFIRTYFGRRR